MFSGAGSVRAVGLVVAERGEVGRGRCRGKLPVVAFIGWLAIGGGAIQVAGSVSCRHKRSMRRIGSACDLVVAAGTAQSEAEPAKPLTSRPGSSAILGHKGKKKDNRSSYQATAAAQFILTLAFDRTPPSLSTQMYSAIMLPLWGNLMNFCKFSV